MLITRDIISAGDSGRTTTRCRLRQLSSCWILAGKNTRILCGEHRLGRWCYFDDFYQVMKIISSLETMWIISVVKPTWTFLDPFLSFTFYYRVVFDGDILFTYRNMTELMIKEGVIAFIGPDETCLHEALVASAWNLPLISYVNSILLGLKDLFSLYRASLASHSKDSCILILHFVHSVTFIYPLVLCWHKTHQQDALSHIRTDISRTAWKNI